VAWLYHFFGHDQWVGPIYAIMGLKVQIWQYCTINFFSHPPSYTITPSCSIFLPST
jgi:hypothetical protein